MALVALIVAWPVVRFVPHARSSRFFDLLLLGATALVAFLVGWLALGLATSGTLAVLTGVSVADVPILAVIAGALAGALVLNLSLWVIDLFAPPPFEDEQDQPDDIG